MRNIPPGEAQKVLMLNRLDWATASGRRLDGVKIIPATDEKSEYQKKDLPSINILEWQESEDAFEGGTGDLMEVNGTITFGFHIHQRMYSKSF